MTPRETEIYTAISNAFSNAEISVEDTAGDQDHFRLTIVSTAFEGKNRIARQRMAIDALGPLAKEIHALEYRLSTPI